MVTRKHGGVPASWRRPGLARYWWSRIAEENGRTGIVLDVYLATHNCVSDYASKRTRRSDEDAVVFIIQHIVRFDTGPTRAKSNVYAVEIAPNRIVHCDMART